MASSALVKYSKLVSTVKYIKPLTSHCRKFTTCLNDQQLEIQEQVREFTNVFLKPNAKSYDIQGRFPFDAVLSSVLRVPDQNSTSPSLFVGIVRSDNASEWAAAFSEIRRLTDLGFMGATVSKDYGGLGLDYLSLALAVEELSRGCASTGMIVSIHNFLYANLVNEKGTPEQKEIFLRDFTKGAIGCFALSEPGAGSDAANIRTMATRDGDYWIINGRKSWVTSAIEGQALAVFATFEPELKHKGIACFLIPLETEGVFRGNKEPLMSVRAATACDVTFQEVRIPNSYVVGQPGEGFKIAMEQLDQARIGIAAHAVGIAQAALDTAINYAKKRQAFGKSLTRLPSVKDHLSEMSLLVETARLLTYRAATSVSTKNSAMAKYVAGRNATAVADHCVQILGGRGLSTQYDAERHYRDARGTQIYGGVTDIQKRLIGHYLLKENDAL